MLDELWTEFRDLYRRQGSRPSPWKRNAKRQYGCLRRAYNQKKRTDAKGKGEKENTHPYECTVPKNSKER